MLNETLTFESLRPADQGAFIGTPEKRALPAGFRLYKFTQYAAHRTAFDGAVTPWWSSVDPLDASDPGLAGTLERAERVGSSPNEFARARAAVTLEWNAMTNLERVRLISPVWAFVGRCRTQRLSVSTDERTGAMLAPNVYLIGGAWQLFIPNLSWVDIALDV
jgi:hypothetical protein